MFIDVYKNSHYFNLKVRMVSQGAQTNGDKNNRRLMKSYSEVGQFGVGSSINGPDSHEPLQRTQSEEPPRSVMTGKYLKLHIS